MLQIYDEEEKEENDKKENMNEGDDIVVRMK